LYYLNFCFNIFFYSLSWPKQIKKILISLSISILRLARRFPRNLRLKRRNAIVN
jgi:hypothetical protein